MKVACSPVLQNFPIERRTFIFNFGEILQVLTCAVREGMTNSAVCIDCMWSTLGRVTVRGRRDGLILIQCRVSQDKWPVQPESAIALEVIGC